MREFILEHAHAMILVQGGCIWVLIFSILAMARNYRIMEKQCHEVNEQLWEERKAREVAARAQCFYHDERVDLLRMLRARNAEIRALKDELEQRLA